MRCMLSWMLTRLRSLAQRRRVAREIDDELAFHLEMETEAHTKRGMTPEDARRRALLDMGGFTQTKEAVHDVRAFSGDALWRDVRHAVRALRKRPAFATLVVVTLALGISVNAASLAAVYGLLVRPLPYHDAGRIVTLNLLFADGGNLGFSPAALRQWLPRLTTVESSAGYYRREVTVTMAGRAVVVPAAMVTDRFFEVLGAPAAAGQARTSVNGADVVISARHIVPVMGTASAPAAVGTAVEVSGQPRQISGVMPGAFAFPDSEVGVWIPSRALFEGTAPENAGYSRIVARLKPGVTVEQVQDDATRVYRELNPGGRGETVAVTVLEETATEGIRPVVVAAATGALLVLLVACANVATLCIGRDIGRRREFAARLALGASRLQLVRGIVVETALLALLATVAGVTLAELALRVLARNTVVLPVLQQVGLGLSTAVAGGLLTAVVVLLSAVIPAWSVVRGEFTPFLKPTSTGKPRAWHVRRGLVVTQIALSCVLLIGAGLLVRTVLVLSRANHGFQVTGGLEAKLVLSDRVLSDDDRQPLLRDLQDRVRALPGVQHVGVGSNLPPHPPPATIGIRLVDDGRDETRFMKLGSATPGYLRALGVRFLAGRDFVDTDSDQPVVILSESVARFYFPGQDAVGREISRLPAILGATTPPRVIGVVADVKYEGLDTPAGGALYLPWARRPFGTAYLIVQTNGEPGQIAQEIRRLTRALAPGVPVAEVLSLEDVVARAMAERSARSEPALVFGVLAVVVALGGLFSMLSTLVSERHRDLAIRSCLGAAPTRLVREVVVHALALTAIGLVLGIGLAAAVTRSLAAFLYGTSPYEPAVFVGTVLSMAAGAAVLAYVAAVRAYRIEPMVVLRHE